MANSNCVQQNGWGGNWTEQKLDCFESYVRAYLTIMNVYRDKYHWRLIYFDGFAGCGSRTEEETTQEVESLYNLFGDELVDKQELSVYQGAAERVVRLEEEMRGFDFYYFIDLYEENCTKLELKLADYPTKGYKLFRPGDANIQIQLLAAALERERHFKSLVLLDPFGMQLDWSGIQAIAGKSVDLWILVPSGMVINRLLKKNGELLHPEKLVKFFGMSEEDIKKWFYVHREETTLFGDVKDVVIKKSKPIELIAELFVNRLGELFPYVTPEPLVMRNRNNVPIFHFICASFSPTAVKIAQQIINKRNR